MSKKRPVIEAMIRIYCEGRCQNETLESGLCQECEELLTYALERLEKCPKVAQKTSCGRCEIPCYREPFKSRIRLVMKYAGPRMVVKHPIKTVKYVMDHF